MAEELIASTILYRAHQEHVADLRKKMLKYMEDTDTGSITNVQGRVSLRDHIVKRLEEGSEISPEYMAAKATIEKFQVKVRIGSQLVVTEKRASIKKGGNPDHESDTEHGHE